MSRSISNRGDGGGLGREGGGGEGNYVFCWNVSIACSSMAHHLATKSMFHTHSGKRMFCPILRGRNGGGWGVKGVKVLTRMLALLILCQLGVEGGYGRGDHYSNKL